MTDKRNLTLADPLEPEQVAAFLQQNPHFFEAYPDLLSELSLPHESGGAVSLVERQIAVLRERNMDMRHRLSKLLDNARDNDKLFDTAAERLSRKAYDLLLVDVELQLMNGMPLVERLMPERPAAKVLLVATGSGQSSSAATRPPQPLTPIL